MILSGFTAHVVWVSDEEDIVTLQLVKSVSFGNLTFPYLREGTILQYKPAFRCHDDIDRAVNGCLIFGKNRHLDLYKNHDPVPVNKQRAWLEIQHTTIRAAVTSVGHRILVRRCTLGLNNTEIFLTTLLDGDVGIVKKTPFPKAPVQLPADIPYMVLRASELDFLENPQYSG